MKKFVSVAASAALTASMICAPMAIVSAATDVKTAPFVLVMEDQQLKPGKSSVKIPVSFNEDVSFTVMNFKFKSSFFPESKYVTKFAGFESALPDTVALEGNTDNGTVVINTSDAKNYTIKKGTPVFYITVDVMTKPTTSNPTSKPATDVPAGATFKVNLETFDVADENLVTYELPDDLVKSINAVVQSVPEESSASHKVTISAKEATSKTVEVPVYVEGSMFSMRAGLKVDNGAKIVNVTSTVEGVSCNTTGSFAYACEDISGNPYTFTKDTPAVTVTIELPATAKEGDEFTVSSKYFDIADENEKSVYPSTVTPGKITYKPATVSGSISDVKSAVSYIVSSTNKLDLSDVKLNAVLTAADGTKTDIVFAAGGDYDINDYFEVVKEEGSIDRTLELKYVGPELSAPVENVKVSYLRTIKGDIDFNGKVTSSDASVAIDEFLERDFGGSMLETFYKTDTKTYGEIVTKYGSAVVAEFGAKVADVNEDNSINMNDSTYILEYFLENDFDVVEWEDLLKR